MTHAPGQQFIESFACLAIARPESGWRKKIAFIFVFFSYLCVVTDLGEYKNPNDFQQEQYGIAKKIQLMASNSAAQKKDCHFCRQKREKNNREKHIFVFGLSCLSWITMNTLCPVIHLMECVVFFYIVVLLVRKVH